MIRAIWLGNVAMTAEWNPSEIWWFPQFRVRHYGRHFVVRFGWLAGAIGLGVPDPNELLWNPRYEPVANRVCVGVVVVTVLYFLIRGLVSHFFRI